MPSLPLHHRVLGDAHQPPVLLLHGFMGAADDWDACAAALASDFFVIAVDLPGHGWSLRAEQPSLLGFAAAACATLDALGVERAAWVGYSLGGRVALHAAVHHPARVRALVTEGASPGIGDPAAREKRAQMDSMLAASLRELGMVTFLERWYKLGLFRTLRRFPDRVAAMMTRRLRNDAAALADVLEALSPGRQPDLSPALGAITAPTLLLSGTLDADYTALTAAMAQVIPQATRRLIDDAGHNAHTEQPEAFLAALLPFLKAHGGPRV